MSNVLMKDKNENMSSAYNVRTHACIQLGSRPIPIDETSTAVLPLADIKTINSWGEGLDLTLDKRYSRFLYLS